MNKNTVTIYVELLDEGTYSARPTEAEMVGEGLYKVLPTPRYNTAVEYWQFLPGSIVRCKTAKDQFIGEVLMAYEMVEKPAEIKIYVAQREKTDILYPAQAINVGNNKYQLLEQEGAESQTQMWQFAPGTVVHCKSFNDSKKGDILLAYEEVEV